MYFAMMHFAEWGFKQRIVVLTGSMMLHDAEHAWRDRQSEALPFSLVDFAPCSADWISISHAPQL
jgi:hypothetical protein